MDSLKFGASWKGSIQGAKAMVKLGGLLMEGCSFDGARLSENQRDSPSVSGIPPCVVGWIPKVSLDTLYIHLSLKMNYECQAPFFNNILSYIVMGSFTGEDKHRLL